VEPDPRRQHEERLPVVALVGSAGGLEAVLRIVAGLPEHLAAAVLVLLHQSPDHVSHLVSLLGRQSRLAVAEPRDGEPLPAGQITVVPPGTHLLVGPGRRAHVIESGAAPPSRPSADLLLATLATALGDRAIAVVLSGGGHDGATGATAIHACGGTVVASDEASSESFSMPLAAIERDNAVDHVVGVDEVSALVARLVAAQAQPG